MDVADPAIQPMGVVVGEANVFLENGAAALLVSRLVWTISGGGKMVVRANKD